MMLATWYGLARANAIHYAPDDAMLVRFAERGLPATLAREVIDAITSLAADRTRLMRRLAPSMLANPQPRTLPPLESDRVVRLARVFACSQAVLGGLIAARAYFTTPHAALGGRRPIDLIHTDPGADMVSRGFPTITTTYLPNVVAGTLPDLVE
jgi:putative toxin-antitoxin system antitoxin component (TIGR02293 family)